MMTPKTREGVMSGFQNMEWITPYKELQDLTGVYDIRSARRYHVDLRNVMDDKNNVQVREV